MRLTTKGLVGIGETAPGSKLSVSGGGSFGSGYDTNGGTNERVGNRRATSARHDNAVCDASVAGETVASHFTATTTTESAFPRFSFTRDWHIGNHHQSLLHHRLLHQSFHIKLFHRFSHRLSQSNRRSGRDRARQSRFRCLRHSPVSNGGHRRRHPVGLHSLRQRHFRTCHYHRRNRRIRPRISKWNPDMGCHHNTRKHFGHARGIKRRNGRDDVHQQPPPHRQRHKRDRGRSKPHL